MNNATLLTADRGTHVKVVLIALIASIAVSMIGINVHGRPTSSVACFSGLAHHGAARSSRIVGLACLAYVVATGDKVNVANLASMDIW
jgi:hypothetical protein